MLQGVVVTVAEYFCTDQLGMELMLQVLPLNAEHSFLLVMVTIAG